MWKWCSEKEDGTLETGWFKDNDRWFFSNEKGIMQTGWVLDNKRWYYLDEDGVMKTGWLKYKEHWYYLEPNSTGYKGSAYCNCTCKIDGKTYTFNSEGKMLEGLVSNECVDFVKSYEGFFPNKYLCPAGVPTIGYGTTKPEYVNLGTCTKEQATAWLKEEIEAMAIVVKKDLDSKSVNLKQNEFDALCSFSYNCGTAALLGSTVYRRICEGVRDSSLKENFKSWSKANGKTLQGLLNRRIEEYEMFSNADYTRNL